MVNRKKQKGKAWIALLAMLWTLLAAVPVSPALASDGGGIGGIGGGGSSGGGGGGSGGGQIGSALVLVTAAGQTPPSEITAGQEVGFFVRLIDANGNYVSSTSEIALQITQNQEAEGSNITYSGDELVIPAGQSVSQEVYFSAQKAQEYQITVAAENLQPAAYTVTVQPGPFAKVALSGSESVEVNLRNQIDLQLQDLYGNPVNNDSYCDLNLWTTTDSVNGNYATIYDALIGGNALTGVSFTPGRNTATVYFCSGGPGTYTIWTAQGDWYCGNILGSKQVQVTEAELIRANISHESDSGMVAGNRARIVVNQTDMYGNVIVPEAPITFDLGTSSEKGCFYKSGDDEDDATPITSVELAAGQVAAVVYYYDEEAGAPVLTAAISGLEPDQYSLSVEPAAPAAVQMQIGDAIVDNFEYLDICVVDQFGNETYSSDNSPITVNLSSTGNGKFYDYTYLDGDLELREVSQKTIYPDYFDGENWVNGGYLYYKNDTVGEYELTASSTGLTTTIIVHVVDIPEEWYSDRVLHSGWNTFSIPVALEEQTLNSLFGEAAGNVEAVFAYKNKNEAADENNNNGNNNNDNANDNANTPGFQKITDFDKPLNVLDAYFVKVADGKTVPISFYDKVTGILTAPPSKDLQEGWNFVGPALWNDGRELNASANFASIEGKYSQVISPGYNQPSWTYTDEMNYEDEPWVEAGYGYWVFMKEDGTLAGFSYTPADEYYEGIPE